jgi:hypothetical protein
MKKTSSIFLTLVSGLSFQILQAQNASPSDPSGRDTLAPYRDKSSRYYYDYDDDYSYGQIYQTYCSNYWFDYWPNYWFNYWPGWSVPNSRYYMYPHYERFGYYGPRRGVPYYAQHRYGNSPYYGPRRNRAYAPPYARNGNPGPIHYYGNTPRRGFGHTGAGHPASS